MALENESEKTVDESKTDKTETVEDAKTIAKEMAKVFAEEMKKVKDEQKEKEAKIVDDKTIVSNKTIERVEVLTSDRPVGEFKNLDEMMVFSKEYVPMSLLMQGNNHKALGELNKALTTYGNIGTDVDGGSLDPIDAHGILARSVETHTSYIEDTLRVPTINSVATYIDNSSDVTTLMITESSAGTESKAGFATRTITLKKAVTLAPITGELVRFGSLGDIASEVFKSMGFAISKKLQHLIFIADGDADDNDGSITGLIPAIEAVAGNSSIYNVGGGGWSNLNNLDISNIVTRVAAWANPNNFAWYCHQNQFGTLEGIARTLNGNIYTLQVGQRPVPQLYGYPIRFINQMPSAYANDEIGLLFGDLRGVVATGSLGQTVIDTSKEFYFSQDTVVLRAIEHIGVDVYKPGTNGQTGPIIAVRYQTS